MKLQMIKKRCLAARRFMIVNAEDGSQWLSDSVNYYRMVGIRLHEDYIAEVFGLTEKQADRCAMVTVKRTEAFFSDSYQVIGESLEPLRDIWAFDQKILAIRSASGVMYVPRDALAPADYDGWGDLRLTRDRAGEPLIALYHGVFCDALLSPLRWDIAVKLSEDLRMLGEAPVFVGREGDEGVEFSELSK